MKAGEGSSGKSDHRPAEKRTVDMQIISDWVEPGGKVLDLGCGRGIFLQYLTRKKNVFGVGVDVDANKITACLARGLNAYHGDLFGLMSRFSDRFFDRVICSRTLQELQHPADTVLEALRVGRFVTVGFVNNGYWKNRVSLFFRGRRVRNEVYPGKWHESRTIHPVSVTEFEEFCRDNNVRVVNRVFLAGDWRTRRRFLPTLFCGYAVFDLTLDADLQPGGGEMAKPV